MKKRILKVFIIGLIAFLILVLSGQSMNDSPSSHSSEQKKWLEQMKTQKMSYYCDLEDDDNLVNDVHRYVGIISNKLNIEMVETKDLQYALDNNGLIVSKTNRWLKEGYHETNAISSRVFSIYSDFDSNFSISDLKNNTIGILAADSKQLNLQELYSDLTIKVIEVEDVDGLYTLFANNSVDKIIVGEEYPVLVYKNKILAKRVYQINIAHSALKLYIPNNYEILTDILNLEIQELKSNPSVEIGNTYDARAWEQEKFTQLLTKEEKEWIEQHKTLKAALSINPPYTISLNKKLYAPLVATLKNFTRLSGVNIQYVIGENETLTRDYEQYNFDILWVRNGVENVLSTNPIIKSEYVVVGIDGDPMINSIYDLYNYRVGMLYDDKISDGVSFLLAQSNILYYKNEDTLIQKLRDNRLELIIVPRIVFDYYEQKKGMTQLDIRYTLESMYEPKFCLPQNDEILQELLNKTILMQNQIDLIANSFENIPENKDNTVIIRYLIIMGILVVIFMGGYFIRYLLNAKEKKKLTYLFMHDPLTNLPNKYGLTKYVDYLIKKDDVGIVFLLDIDNFKTINDKQGSQFGDQVLLEYSQRLLSILNENMILGRSGGDEFCLVLNKSDENEKDHTIAKIKDITRAYADSVTSLNAFSINIAITQFPLHGQSFEELYKYGEYTLTELKNTHITNGVMEFVFEIYDKQANEQLLIKELKHALQNDEFVSYIQPQTLLPEEKVVGGEMLVRWQHPEKGLIFPNAFIEILEDNGIIQELDFYILKIACAEIKKWQEDYPDIKISVNMSPQSLTSSKLIPLVLECLDKFGFNPRNLVMEVTEDMGFKSFEEANKIFDQLKQIGIRIALDDFGKGYSSLSCLEKLSIDILKIDKALVDNIHLNEESREIFFAILQLAEIMKFTVVVEGVECLEQVEILKMKKDLIAQGYYYSRPICIEDFNTYMQQRRQN